MGAELRQSNIARLKNETFDVLIVGGGINGAVSAAALAGRGVKVALIDKGDFAGFTSSNSANLVWGGMKYMESFDYGLVYKLCRSRNHLMRSYPSTVKEMRFMTVMEQGFRFPPAVLYFGAWLYWLIGGLFTRRPAYVSRADITRKESRVNTDNSAGGFESSEAYLHDNDARFVFQFARRALDYGAAAANYVEALASRRENDYWITDVRDLDGTKPGAKSNGKSNVKSKSKSAKWTIKSKVLINAAGPFADEYNRKCNVETEWRHIFSKGIHLVVDRITDSEEGMVFFASDGRPFYVVPMGPRTVVGTTDTPLEKLPPRVEDEDRRFMLENLNKNMNFSPPLSEKDVIAERCGVRPLALEKNADTDFKDWTQLSRKHTVETQAGIAHVSIFGGKLTDCLNVGDEVTDAVRSLGVALPAPGRRWYGEPPEATREEFFFQAARLDLDGMTAPESSEPVTTRLWRRYGSMAFPMLEAIRRDPTLARPVETGVEYLRVELYHAAEHEMITKLDDFLRRRSKIAQIAPRAEIKKSKGLKEACKVLFGKEASARFNEYFKGD